MRTVSFLVVVLIGCGKERMGGGLPESTSKQLSTEQPGRTKALSPESRKKQGRNVTFDGADVVRTQEWLIQGFLKAMDYPVGNNLAAQMKWDEYRAELRVAEGRMVKWKVKCREVFGNETILLDVLQFHDKKRHYLLSMVFFYDPEPATAQDKPMPSSTQFPAKGKTWLLKVKKGDPLILTGRIRNIAVDNRLERDKGTKDLPAALIWHFHFGTVDLDLAR
jgi:hypothetical protein